MTKRLRLLKVMVQPVFVVDDGETLAEQTAETMTVPAGDWPDFHERLDGQIAELQKNLEG